MRCHAFIGGLVVSTVSLTVQSQDLYDTSVLRTFELQFHDTNWETLLRQNYNSETPILADLTIDGETYPDVGVRIRGNTSYTTLPPGSQKFSLKIYMDYTDPDQDLLGYETINLNNAFRDPTFCREVVYNNFVAQFIPHSRANHALVTINGANWGVYANVQQPNKDMLRDYFENEDGARFRCPNNPNGPGLRYNGSTQSGYTGYEMQDDGGLADPWGALIDVCDAVTNTPLASWEDIDEVFAIDPSIWSVVLENLLTDDDSYVNKGADFMIYRNPIDGRTHLLQRDANETFTDPDWSVTYNFNASNKPVLSHVLDVPELRQRYMAHYRDAMIYANWDYFGPIFEAHRDLIDAHVQADPKKIYSYQNFLDNFTTSVNLGGGGPGGGSVVGLQEFFDTREIYLAGVTELNASTPLISDITVSNDAPTPGESVTVSATVAPSGSPVALVECFYRPDPTGPYDRVTMTNAGGTSYTATLPVSGTPGQRVEYYIGATADNAYDSLAFLPVRSEYDPLEINYTFGSSGVRITEWMYSGDSGEFIEFTNLSDVAVDMTDWSMDDNGATPGAFDLSAFGVIQPGESVIVTEAAEAAFRSAWSLGAGVKIIGELGVVTGSNLGRNDQIHLYDAAGLLADRLSYGDETYPGSVRTRDASGQACVESIGQDEVLAWTLSEAGDEFGSFAAITGEFGTPGTYNTNACNTCLADTNGDGTLSPADFSAWVAAFNTMSAACDQNEDGSCTPADFSAWVANYNAGCN